MRVLKTAKAALATGLAYSPDGATLAVVGPLTKSRDYPPPAISMELWDPAGGTHLRTVLPKDCGGHYFPTVEYAANGRYLALGVRPRSVLDLSDPDDRPQPLTPNWPQWGKWGGEALVFGRGGEVIHGIGNAQPVAQNLSTRRSVKPLQFPIPERDDPTDGPEFIALYRAPTAETFAAFAKTFAPSQQLIYSIAVADETGFRSNEPIREWVSGMEYVNPPLSLSADGNRLAVLEGRKLSVFDSNTGKLLGEIRGRKWMNCCAFSADGRYLGVLFQDSIALYDTTSWTVARTYAWKVGKLLSLAFSPDGATAAVGSDTGKVVVFDLE